MLSSLIRRNRDRRGRDPGRAGPDAFLADHRCAAPDRQQGRSAAARAHAGRQAGVPTMAGSLPHPQHFRRRHHGRDARSRTRPARRSASSWRRARKSPAASSGRAAPRWASSSTRPSICARCSPRGRPRIGFRPRPARLDIKCGATVRLDGLYHQGRVAEHLARRRHGLPADRGWRRPATCCSRSTACAPIKGTIRWQKDGMMGIVFHQPADLRRTRRMAGQADRGGEPARKYEGIDPRPSRRH